jgi:hypothetical protein
VVVAVVVLEQKLFLACYLLLAQHRMLLAQEAPAVAMVEQHLLEILLAHQQVLLVATLILTEVLTIGVVKAHQVALVQAAAVVAVVVVTRETMELIPAAQEPTAVQPVQTVLRVQILVTVLQEAAAVFMLLI